MGLNLIYGKAYQLGVVLPKLLLPIGKGHKLGCAYRGEVSGMAEEHEPFSSISLRQLHRSLCRLHRHLWKSLTQ